MTHKKILYEDIAEQENEAKLPAKKETKILVYNGVIATLSVISKIVVVALVSIIGTIGVTILFTSLFQEKAMSDVATEFITKIISLFS